MPTIKNKRKKNKYLDTVSKKNLKVKIIHPLNRKIEIFKYELMKYMHTINQTKKE